MPRPQTTSSAIAPARLTQAERTAISDERMFNSAFELILERGANKATLKEICENAGYSRGLATNRFGSKDRFLVELLLHFNHIWTDYLKDRIGASRGLPALFAAMDALAEFMVSQNRYMRAGYIIWYESIVGENAIRRQLAVNHKRYRADVRCWVEQAVIDGTARKEVDADAFACFYLSWVSGTVYQWLVDPDSIELESMFNHIRGVVQRELAIGYGAK